MIDDSKVAIGAHPTAIPALIGLSRKDTIAEKRNVETALANLVVCNPNKVSVVIARSSYSYQTQLEFLCHL